MLEKDRISQLMVALLPTRQLPLLLFVPTLLLALAAGWLQWQTSSHGREQLLQLEAERIQQDLRQVLERLDTLNDYLSGSSVSLLLQSPLLSQRQAATERLQAIVDLYVVDALSIRDSRNRPRFELTSTLVDPAQFRQFCDQGAGLYTLPSGLLLAVQSHQWLSSRGTLQVCSATHIAYGMLSGWRLLKGADAQGIALPVVGQHQYHLRLQDTLLQPFANPWVYGLLTTLVGLGLLLNVALARRWRAVLRGRQQLRQEAQQLAFALSLSEEAQFWLDHQGRVQRVNTAALALLNVGNETQLIGAPLAEWLPLPVAELMDKAFRQRAAVRGELAPLAKRARSSGQLSYALQPLPASLGALMTVRDRHDERALQRALQLRDQRDPVSGLASRRRFTALMRQQLAAGLPAGAALLVADVDGFSLLNESMGWAQGDAVLQQIALELQRCSGERDLLCRLDGDQFAWLIVRDAPVAVLPAVDALRVALRRGAGGAAMSVRPEIRLSCGLVMLPARGAVMEHALASAVRLMRSAQRNGGDQLQSRPLLAMPVVLQSDAEQVQMIRDAIRHDRLMLYVQPVRPLQGSGQVIWEVFVRLLNDQAEVISAAEFLPVAEHHGLLRDIDEWVIANLLRSPLLPQLLGDEQQGLVSINLSASSLLRNDFLQGFQDLLAQSPVDPTRLCVEVSERLLLSGQRLQQSLESVAAQGCSLMIDDFTAGLGAMATLKGLPVQYVKLDRALTANIVADSVDRRLLAALVMAAHDLGLQTVAECAESVEVVRVLGDMGVDFCQGYAIARPFPLDELQLRLHQAKTQLRQSGQTLTMPALTRPVAGS